MYRVNTEISGDVVVRLPAIVRLAHILGVDWLVTRIVKYVVVGDDVSSIGVLVGFLDVFDSCQLDEAKGLCMAKLTSMCMRTSDLSTDDAKALASVGNKEVVADLLTAFQKRAHAAFYHSTTVDVEFENFSGMSSSLHRVCLNDQAGADWTAVLRPNGTFVALCLRCKSEMHPYKVRIIATLVGAVDSKVHARLLDCTFRHAWEEHGIPRFVSAAAANKFTTAAGTLKLTLSIFVL